MKYELGQYANGHSVGTFRKDSDGKKIFWDGDKWIDDYLFNEKDYEEPSISDPFTDNFNNEIESDNPFYETLPREQQLINEIRQFTTIQQDALAEIQKRQDELFRLIGGARLE